MTSLPHLESLRTQLTLQPPLKGRWLLRSLEDRLWSPHVGCSMRGCVCTHVWIACVCMCVCTCVHLLSAFIIFKWNHLPGFSGLLVLAGRPLCLWLTAGRGLTALLTETWQPTMPHLHQQETRLLFPQFKTLGHSSHCPSDRRHCVCSVNCRQDVQPFFLPGPRSVRSASLCR